MSKTNTNGRAIAIVACIFLFGMISFVTNLAAPIGVIWKNQPMIGGSNMLGMMGNFMNFFAYLFMGIPAGNLLSKIGYKKTALIGIAFGFFGVLVQFLSGFSESVTGFVIYLIGAFISGFSVCMLNTVVNPMLNQLGGGGNRGNQLNLIGGTFNSLLGTMTPMLVGALIGTVTKDTAMSDVNLVLYMAMGVFLVTFFVLLFVPIDNPKQMEEDVKFEHTPFAFRHFTFGVIAIFVYVGVECGIPGTLNFYISDTSANGAGVMGLNPMVQAAAIGGFAAGTYWLLMLVGRLISSFIASKVSSRAMMLATTGAGTILIILAMFLPKTITGSLPVFTGSGFQVVTLPLGAILLVLCGLCTSIMWSSLFNLATEGLGKYTEKASGIFMMMVVGGGVLPLIQNAVADATLNYMLSYIVPLLAVVYMFCYAAFLSKNVNKDIPV
ncbi:MAG TPA: MFS transporter [Prevotella sp.]|nr:MFS transporter [Prevotella sp.]